MAMDSPPPGIWDHFRSQLPFNVVGGLMKVGDLIRYADRHGVHYGLVMKIIEPDIDDDRQIYCSWLNENPSHWSWVEQEDAEVISASR